MKKLIFISILCVIVALSSIGISSCASAKLTAKSGNELWSEDCARCHNAPGKSTYSPKEWKAIGLHMRMRAQIPADETEKLVAYLKGEE